MNKVTQAGKKIGKSQKEAGLNVRRAAENFVQPARIVNSFNRLHPYTSQFVATPGSTALLSLKITEYPTPCTVNPPLLNISTESTHSGDNPGYVINLYNTSSELDPPNKDFLLVDGGIQVPLDGCYNVLWTSGAWGVSYYGDKTVTVGLLRQGYLFRSAPQGATQVTFLLGPPIYSYAPVSPLYAVVDCKAGDIITAFLTENDISQGYPWYNQTGLEGFFVSTGAYAAHITVTLVAVAEA